LVACAIHHGHEVRPEIAALLRIQPEQRRYEEDPFTGGWTSIAATRIVGLRSRFEVDLNRPREKAVYLTPADAWGLEVWKMPPSEELVRQSLSNYDDFYSRYAELLERLLARHRRIVVFDLHSYNHRRGGPDAPPADPERNPEINLGTGSLDRDRWRPVVERFLSEIQTYDCSGRRLDVRENVKFFGGHLARWTHANFAESVGVLAIEVKKFFMDEWTGQLDRPQFDAVRAALAQAAAGVRDVLIH
jgi:N-formylglutamate amidohydrolase